MTSDIELKINQNNPSIPLLTLTTFIGSGITLTLINVYKNASEVWVEITYSDGYYSKQATKTNDLWICTLPSSNIVSEILNGYVIKYKDNSGVVYTIGLGDVHVLSLNAIPSTVNDVHIMRYVDTKPNKPNKGDSTFDDDDFVVYNGSLWKKTGSDVKPVITTYGGEAICENNIDITSLDDIRELFNDFPDNDIVIASVSTPISIKAENNDITIYYILAGSQSIASKDISQGEYAYYHGIIYKTDNDEILFGTTFSDY